MVIITSKSKTRKFYFIASAVVLFIAAGVFAYQYFSELYQISKAEQGNKDLRDEVVNISSDMPVDYDDYLLDSDGSSDKEYVSPIDFKKLKQKNNDAIAWLTISDTEFSFPLMLLQPPLQHVGLFGVDPGVRKNALRQEVELVVQFLLRHHFL